MPIEGMARELEDFGSLELLYNDRMQRVEKLERQVEQAKAGLKALRKEQARVQAAIIATRDGALREMESTGQMARQQIDHLLSRMNEYNKLQRAAESLKEELALARAFMSQDQDEWQKVPVWVMQRLILGLIHWTGTGEHNRMMSPPEPVCLKYPWLMTRHKVALTDLLVWVLVGMHVEEKTQPFARGLASR